MGTAGELAESYVEFGSPCVAVAVGDHDRCRVETGTQLALDVQPHSGDSAVGARGPQGEQRVLPGQSDRDHIGGLPLRLHVTGDLYAVVLAELALALDP